MARSKKKPVASALRAKKSKRTAQPMNTAIVASYSAALNKVLGSADFDDVFSRLKSDSTVGQAEAVSIASEILESKIASSTTRTAALGRILKLHGSVVTFKLKQRAVGGRSAA